MKIAVMLILCVTQSGLLVGARDGGCMHIGFPPIQQQRDAFKVNEREIQLVMTSVANKIEMAKLALSELDAAFHIYCQKKQFPAECLNLWSCQLKKQSDSLCDVMEQLQHIITKVDECSLVEAQGLSQEKRVEVAEREGAVVQKMMTRFCEGMAQADIAAYWLKAWMDFLEAKVARGKLITSRLSLWNNVLQQKGNNIQKLQVCVQQLIEKINSLSLLISKKQ